MDAASLTTFGAPSTTALASFRPKPVASRTTLITLTLFVIVKFDGMSVSGSKDLIEKLEYYEAGETVEVVISRAENGEYKEITVTVTLGRRSEMKQSVEK